MSVTQIIQIQCDDCGTTYEVEESNVLKAEKQAMKNGWEEKHGEHYCQKSSCG